MDIIVIPIIYYTLFGFLIIFSQISNLGLVIKLTESRNIFILYIFVELFISALLVIYSIIAVNYALVFLGAMIFIFSAYSLVKQDDYIDQIKLIGDQYDYIAGFTCFFLAAIIYFFDISYSA